MPKRIVILDPNGAEVAMRDGTAYEDKGADLEKIAWEVAAQDALVALANRLKHENPKLGTYTVTVKEIDP